MSLMSNIEQDPTFNADITSLSAGAEHGIHRFGLISGGLERQFNSVRNDGLGSDAVSSSYQDTSMLNTDGAGGRHSSNIVSDNPSSTGIKIRIRSAQPQNSSFNPNFADHGTAPRRIRLQKKLQVGPVRCKWKISDESEVDNGFSAEVEVRQRAVTL